MSAADRFPSYRAPQADRRILCVPPWESLRKALASARDHIERSDVEILGVPLQRLASEARDALVSRAQTYTAAYAGSLEVPREPGPLIVTGHQPVLAHAGVWLKNFAADRLAKEVGGKAINLIIDSDLCRSPSIRVPSGSIDAPRSEDVAFDQPQPDMPFEERTIVDRAIWQSFGDRATSTLASLVGEPLIADWWGEVTSISDENDSLGLSVSQARHRLEQSWGVHNLEVPQSHVCETAPFRHFALYLLTNAAGVRSAYNASLAEYRAAHRLRSPAQPLPDLAEVDGWIETPLWVWTTDDPTRRPLYVQSDADGLLVSDRSGWQDTLPLTSSGPFDAATQRLAEWRDQGVKVRSRALITTLYARLLLADTFIHGIGGAKYDQVTNLICQRLFGVELPAYVTLTGTLRLPIEHESIAASQVSDVRQSLRRLRYHPECYLDPLDFDTEHRSQVDDLISLKQRWVQTPKTPENAGERHQQIESANQGLQSWLQAQRQQIEAELDELTTQTRANQILESREYPFCLFPHELLRDFLLDFSSSIP